MPEDLSTKACCIVDNGLFTELAPRLARSFGHVYYAMPWVSAYPRAASAYVGTGLAKNVERVLNFWDIIPEVDCVIFPDLYYAAEQRVIREQFKLPVWGHGDAERLELDRWGTRRLQRDLGIAAPPTKFISGLGALEDHLSTCKDKWVKISCHRGDGETWHHETPHATSTYLHYFRNKVGALADEYEFMVEGSVDGVEAGYDGWTVKGEYPSSAFWGFEVKDKGYIGKFAPYHEHPDPVRQVNAKFAPIFAREESIGFFSFEFRYNGDAVPYVIDPMTRAGSPPMEGTMEGYANLPEIMWDGANGRLAAPEAAGKYVAIAMVHCAFALTNWVPISVSKEDRRWLKLRNPAVVGGKLFHVPGVGSEMPEIGGVVAVHDDLDEAIRLVKERAERIHGYNLVVHTDALDAAQEEIKRAAEYGIVF